MRPLRLRSNSFYFTLDEHEKRCYNAGLPHRYMGAEIRDMSFLPYQIGESNRKLVTDIRQEQELIKFTNDLSVVSGFNGIMAFHSAPTDDTAFKAAAAVFEVAVKRGFSCQCLSTSQLLSREVTEAKDVYLLHGINDLPNPQAIWAVRDFLRDRDGSLRMVVMTSGQELELDILIHERMRMHFDFLFCLKEEQRVIKVDYRKKTYDA